MRVRMLRTISGLLNGQPYPVAGEEWDVPAVEVPGMVARGDAEVVEEAAIETASIAPPEQTARTKRPPARKG